MAKKETLPQRKLNFKKKPIPEISEKTSEIQEEMIAEELIESLTFRDGENILEIRFSKTHARKVRIQIFLNGTIELRPVTYNGSNTGHAYWELLKRSLKK